MDNRLGKRSLNWARVENALDHRNIKIVLFLFLVVLTIRGPVQYCRSDSWGSIQTGQSLLISGDLTLDEFPDYVKKSGYRTYEKDGHTYYFFPPGASLIATPLIWLGSAMGLDPTSNPGERLLQMILAALFFGGSGVIFLRLARSYLPPVTALVLALVFTLGTGASSTLAVAFWSQTPANFLVLFGLMLILCYPDKPGRWFFLPGLILGFAVWCRPTAGLACIAIFLIPSSVSKGRLYFLCGATGMIVGLFLFTMLQMGQWIHPYYLPARMSTGTFTKFIRALNGNLFSASRGLFITTAFLGPIIVLALVRFRQLEFRRIVIVGLVWFLILVLWVCRFKHWWGGYCFGNRLLIDALPPLFLISILVVRDLRSFSGRLRKISIIFILSVTAIFSVWMHVCQGLYNPATAAWCHVQNIDRNPDRFWNWSQAQWLADQDMIASMVWRNKKSDQKTIPLYEQVFADTPGVVFESFNRVERTRSKQAYRWSKGSRSLVIWRHKPLVERPEPHTLKLTIGAFHNQVVKVVLNGLVLGTTELSGFKPVEADFPLPGIIPAAPDGYDTDCLILELLPDNPVTGVAYQRHIGVSFWGAVID